MTANQLGIVRPSNNVTQRKSTASTFLGIGIGPNDSATSARHSTTTPGKIPSAIHWANTSCVSEDSTPTPAWIAISRRTSTACSISTACRPFCWVFRSMPSMPAASSDHRFLLNDYATYFQDDYKVTRNLTVNLGLRWDLMSAPQDALHHMANVIPSLMAQGKSPLVYPKSVNDLNIPGLVGTANETASRQQLCLQLGTAYRLCLRCARPAHHVLARRLRNLLRARTVWAWLISLAVRRRSLRTSRPIGSSRPAGNPLQRSPAGREPDRSQVCSPALTSGGFHRSDDRASHHPIPTCIPFSAAVTYIETAMSAPQHYVSPSTQQWNLSVQRSLPAKLGAWKSAMSGPKARTFPPCSIPCRRRLASPQNPIVVQDVFGNTYTITQNTQLNVGARSPVLGLNPRGYFQFNNDATSRYNSLQATLAHQFAEGFHFQGAYTFSKSIDPVVTSVPAAYQSPLNDQTRLSQSMAVSILTAPIAWCSVTTTIHLSSHATMDGRARYSRIGRSAGSRCFNRACLFG